MLRFLPTRRLALCCLVGILLAAAAQPCRAEAVEQIPPDHFRIVAVRNINSIQIIRKSIQIAIVELRIGAIPEPGKYPLLAVIAYPSQ